METKKGKFLKNKGNYDSPVTELVRIFRYRFKEGEINTEKEIEKVDEQISHLSSH